MYSIQDIYDGVRLFLEKTQKPLPVRILSKALGLGYTVETRLMLNELMRESQRRGGFLLIGYSTGKFKEMSLLSVNGILPTQNLKKEV